jgi:hypothetical protein
MRGPARHDVVRAEGPSPATRRQGETVMQTSLRNFLLIGAGAVWLAALPASATPMDDLKKQGYSCERAGVDSHMCTKAGSPTKYCDNAGQCTRTTAGSGGVMGQTTGTMTMGTGGAAKRVGGKSGVANLPGMTSSELTAQECTRLGGEITANGDPNCKSNQRCKMTLSNGDLRSVCIDEVSQ